MCSTEASDLRAGLTSHRAGDLAQAVGAARGAMLATGHGPRRVRPSLPQSMKRTVASAQVLGAIAGIAGELLQGCGQAGRSRASQLVRNCSIPGSPVASAAASSFTRNLKELTEQ